MLLVFFFKHKTAYEMRISDWSSDVSSSDLNPQSRGWVGPATTNAQLVYAQGKQMLIALGVEQKLLPSSVVQQAVDERASELEQRQGFKPGRKQLRDLKDQVTAELMPRAFAKRRSTRAWIDPVSGRSEEHTSEL